MGRNSGKSKGDNGNESNHQLKNIRISILHNMKRASTLYIQEIEHASSM